MSKAVTWINHFINTECVSSPENVVTICCVSVFCEFFNFNFNFAMLHDWPTVYMYQCASNGDTGGDTVLLGHLVINYVYQFQKNSIA